MKKRSFFAVVLTIGIAAGLMNTFKAKAEPLPAPHACVLVASTPTTGTLSCIGDGSACAKVGDCINN